MDTISVVQLLEQLDDEIDDLEEALSPVLVKALSSTASKLPVLDKAKLYVLVTYAIESVLFSYLRLHGVNAREHPVFKELERVKQYFNKIKVAGTPAAKRENITVNKEAAARFIRAGLSGNDKHDLERAERRSKEGSHSHIKFEEHSQQDEVRKTAKIGARSQDESFSESDINSETETKLALISAAKKRKADALKSGGQDETETTYKRKKNSDEKSKKKKDKKKSSEHSEV